jgi:hypothetical protein
VIRFSAFLVVVAVGLLVAGVVTSDLKLVFASIGVSAVALVALGVSMLTKRRELFGQPGSTEPSAVPRPAEPVRPEAADAGILPAQPAAQAPPWEVAVPASGWPVAAAHSAETQPAETMARAAGAAPWGSAVKPPGERPPDPRRQADVKRPPAAYASGPPAGATAPAPGAWPWREDAPVTQPLPRAVAVPAPASPAAEPPTMAFPVSETLATADVAPAEAPEAAGAPEAPETPAAAEALETAEVAEAPHEPEAGEDEQPDAPAAEDHSSPELTQQLPVAAAPEAASEAGPEPAAVDLEREVTVVPGVPRYHNAQCLLIRFMDEGDLDKMTLGAAQQAGCTPCRACLPELRPPELRPAEPKP